MGEAGSIVADNTRHRKKSVAIALVNFYGFELLCTYFFKITLAVVIATTECRIGGGVLVLDLEKTKMYTS